jgi:RNA polymerase sigma factor (sigma-70 family)
MTTEHLGKTLNYLRRVLPAAGAGGLTDGQLLARFVAGRDEAAFEALVHRHGPMVLGLCRRVLHNLHDAEDAFQATFLLLARKAASVVKRDSVGSWLYAVAYRTALEARAVLARRRQREWQVEEMPHPEVAPVDVQDWRPLLDRELARLPEKYRAAVVLYHLEGRGHREAARQLGLPEGTLSSRLTKARRLLAARLARYGLSLPAGALTAALSEGTATAALPPPLAASTVGTAALAASGQLAAVSQPVALLTQGVLKTMFLKKLSMLGAVLVVTAALGMGGLAYRAGSQAVAADKPERGKPASELEALRKENELLRLNLQVVLEKVRAQEAELHKLKAQLGAKGPRQSADEALKAYSAAYGVWLKSLPQWKEKDLEKFSPYIRPDNWSTIPGDYAKPKGLAKGWPGALKPLDDALKVLREARTPDERQRATKAVEKALRQLDAMLKTYGR